MRAILVGVLMMACGERSTGDADAGRLCCDVADGGLDAGACCDEPPITLAEMQAFVRGGDYLGWVAEPARHPPKGPHGQMVRTFVNPALLGSLKRGEATHPAGSIAVKELYTGDAISGYAVDVKRADGTWVFFEGFLPGLDQYFFTGTENLCGNCHRAGRDFVLTAASDFP